MRLPLILGFLFLVFCFTFPLASHSASFASFCHLSSACLLCFHSFLLQDVLDFFLLLLLSSVLCFCIDSSVRNFCVFYCCFVFKYYNLLYKTFLFQFLFVLLHVIFELFFQV